MGKYAARGLALTAETDEIGQLTSLGEAGSSRDLIDASAYDDEWTDWVVGQQDGDEVDFEVAYDPIDTGHVAMLAIYDAGNPADFEIEHATSGFHVGFPALITACARGGPRNGLLTLKGSMKILNPGVQDIEESS